MSRAQKIIDLALAEPSEPSIELDEKNNSDSNENLMSALMHDVILIENYCDNNLGCKTDEISGTIGNENFVYLDLLSENQPITYTNILSSTSEQTLQTDQEINVNTKKHLTQVNDYQTFSSFSINLTKNIVNYSDSEPENYENNQCEENEVQNAHIVHEEGGEADSEQENNENNQREEGEVTGCDRNTHIIHEEENDAGRASISNSFSHSDALSSGVGSSSEMDEDDNSETDEDNNFKGKKRKRPVGKVNKNRELKSRGKSYHNYKNELVKEKRVLENPCLQKRCVNSCNRFSEEERNSIFTVFWELKSHNEKRAFINGCVNVVPVKRKRTLNERSRRGLTYQYFMMKGDVQERVCLQFFQSTLNISQKLIRSSLQGKIQQNLDLRGTHVPKHKLSDVQITELDNFIKRLTAVPSHYCRASTKKLYLPSNIKNFTNLYRMYTSSMEEISVKPLSLSSFKKLFRKKYNIGIHVPRKDKCLKCEKYKNTANTRTEIDQQNFLRHQADKDKAKLCFLEEQSKSAKTGHLVVSFDLQKVLSTPHSNSMVYGFSRKYAVYNFTVYESGSQNGYCFLWGEKDGKKGAVEICTALYLYLKELDQGEKYLSIALFCDNCPGQNKNKIMLSMLLYFLQKAKSISSISLTYLVAGHTYMPVDSVHAVIERCISSMTIQAPSEWPTVIRNSRKRPRPYEVRSLNHTHFLDWKALITPRKLKTAVGEEIKISSITKVIFSKDDISKITVFTDYEFTSPLKIDFSIKNIIAEVPRAYFSDIPICPNKLKDLLKLCKEQQIKDNYHVEYFSMSANSSVPDTLPETDVEDNE